MTYTSDLQSASFNNYNGKREISRPRGRINESNRRVLTALTLFPCISRGKAGNRDEEWHGLPDETYEGKLLDSERLRRTGRVRRGIGD